MSIKAVQLRKMRLSIDWDVKEGVCCWNMYPVTFQRIPRDDSLEDAYSLRTFWKHSIHMTSMFSYARSIMDMKIVMGGGTSFLKLYGNFSIALPAIYSSFLLLWSNDALNLTASSKRSRRFEQAVRETNAPINVPILSRKIRLHSNVTR